PSLNEMAQLLEDGFSHLVLPPPAEPHPTALSVQQMLCFVRWVLASWYRSFPNSPTHFQSLGVHFQNKGLNHMRYGVTAAFTALCANDPS
ncbi:hypothetical protein L0F63_006237, partial [Massospora cicadina]